MRFDEALKYLLSLGHETLTIKLGLENTRTLLAALGNPQQDFPSVQIAGTNGKGSTAVMLDCICREAGICTGLFTSPHLISITERIMIGGREISKDEFARLTKVVKESAETLVRESQLQTLPTFFEQVTAIAFLALREAGVDLAILETGLGGRLDSTTAAEATVVAITRVARDHEDYLGSTIPEIAAEKAAIIRPGVIAVIAPQSREADAVILRRCKESNVYPIVLGTSEAGYGSHLLDVDNGRCRVTFDTPNGRYGNVRLGLRGRHQIDNALTAIALAESLRPGKFKISDEAIVRGLESASHAGRLELFEDSPAILLDGAHNPSAAETLRAYLEEFVPQPVTIIFGAMRDKALPEMTEILFPAAKQLILTEFENPRAASRALLESAIPMDLDRRRISFSRSAEEALDLARCVSSLGDLICVTGSLHLVGAIRKLIQ